MEQGKLAANMIAPHATALAVLGKAARKILATVKVGFAPRMISRDVAE